MDKPVFDKGLVLSDKLICLSKTLVSNARGSPWVMLMPSPRGRDKIANAPTPGLTTWANAPRLPGGTGHRWNRLMHYTTSFIYIQCCWFPADSYSGGIGNDCFTFLFSLFILFLVASNVKDKFYVPLYPQSVFDHCWITAVMTVNCIIFLQLL